MSCARTHLPSPLEIAHMKKLLAILVTGLFGSGAFAQAAPNPAPEVSPPAAAAPAAKAHKAKNHHAKATKASPKHKVAKKSHKRSKKSMA